MRERVDFYQQGLLDDDSPARVQDLLTGYTSRIPFVGGLLSDVIDPREVLAADLDREAASLEKCAKDVADNPTCGNAFFFRENKGRCLCEKHDSTCTRKENINVNEYSLNVG